jgi:hypothetical protein
MSEPLSTRPIARVNRPRYTAVLLDDARRWYPEVDCRIDAYGFTLVCSVEMNKAEPNGNAFPGVGRWRRLKFNRHAEDPTVMPVIDTQLPLAPTRPARKEE